MKILLAVDGSAYSDAAIEEVQRRPWPLQSEIRVITAAETPTIVGAEAWALPPEVPPSQSSRQAGLRRCCDSAPQCARNG